jgi:cell division protein ZipA
VQDLIQTLTADLRLSLLVLGAIIISALILWELWQRWRARKADEAHIAGPDDVDDVLVQDLAQADEGLEIEDDRAPETVTRNTSTQSRTTTNVAPAAGASFESADSLELPRMSARDDFDDRWASLVAEKRVGATSDDESIESSLEPVGEPTRHDLQADPSEDSGELPDDGVIGPAREVSPRDASPRDASPREVSAREVSAREPDLSPRMVVRIEWPPEDQRRVVGLRIVGKGGERFTGASLRQALQGEGFVFGEMEIFHRPMSDGRVVMSAASLTQPGTFNLDTMDASLFRGLNLFAVLPGPLPGREAVDKLLLVGHTLAQRVRGELQDGRGQALTEARLAEMRREAGSSSV